jgi:hypothetical protein
MKTSGRMLMPGLVLAAVVAAGEPPPPAVRQEPEAPGMASARASKGELRPAQDPAQVEKRPAVRVILPSPYSSRP